MNDDLFRVFMTKGPERVLIAARIDGIHVMVGFEKRTVGNKLVGEGGLSHFENGEDAFQHIASRVGEMFLYGFKVECIEGHADSVRYAMIGRAYLEPAWLWPDGYFGGGNV